MEKEILCLILMTTYNGEKYLKDQIDSILAQTYTGWNLLIQDDDSNDNTYDILTEYGKKDSRIHIFRNEYSLGATLNFEKLMLRSKADYIMFCDQDDVWLEDKVEVTIDELINLELKRGKNTPIVVYTDQQIVDESLHNIENIARHYNSTLFGILCQNHVYGCTMAINKILKENVLPFPKYVVGHDYWLALNAAALGEVHFIDYKSMLYRQHSGNVTGGMNNYSLWNKLNKWRRTNDNIKKTIYQNYNFCKSIYMNNDAQKYIEIVETPRILRPVRALKNGFSTDRSLALLRILYVFIIYDRK